MRERRRILLWGPRVRGWGPVRRVRGERWEVGWWVIGGGRRGGEGLVDIGWLVFWGGGFLFGWEGNIGGFRIFGGE